MSGLYCAFFLLSDTTPIFRVRVHYNHIIDTIETTNVVIPIISIVVEDAIPVFPDIFGDFCRLTTNRTGNRVNILEIEFLMMLSMSDGISIFVKYTGNICTTQASVHYYFLST